MEPCSSVSIVNFEQVNAGWEVQYKNIIIQFYVTGTLKTP